MLATFWVENRVRVQVSVRVRARNTIGCHVVVSCFGQGYICGKIRGMVSVRLAVRDGSSDATFSCPIAYPTTSPSALLEVAVARG